MTIRAVLLTTTAVGFLWAGAASAQSQADAPKRTAAVTEAQNSAAADAGESGVIVEELVVTARQHISNLEDAPVAVTTFNAEQRNITAANTVTDLVNLTPGVTISGNGMNVRGIGRQTSETAALGSDPAVGYYVNGFYSVVAGVVGESTLYSETVQFLRGPQGTQFGRNAIAGASSLYARHPTKDFHGEVVGQYGTNGFWGAGLNMAGPIGDRVGWRFGYQHFGAEDSYQENIYPTQAGILVRNNYFEAQLEARPTDRLHFWLRSTTFNYKSDPFYTAPAVYNTTASMGSLVPNPTFGYTVKPPTEPNVINVDTKGIDKLTGNQVHILNADWDLGGATLYYVGGYAGYKSSGYSDLDRAGRVNYTVCFPSQAVTCTGDTAPFPGLAPGAIVSTRQLADYLNRNHYYTHEIRLQNNNTDHLEWVLGGFYLNSNYNEAYEQTLPDEPLLENPILSFTTFAAAAANPSRSFYQQHNIRKTQSQAVFGDITWHLNPQWDIAAGLRYSVEEATADTQVRYIFFNPAFGRSLDVTPGLPSGAVGPSGAHFSLKNEKTTGRFVVKYAPSDETLYYFKFSTGFKAGGFNLGNITTTTNNVTKPEYLYAYEAGLKHTFSPTLRGDATVFYYDYRDMQIPVSQLNPINNAVFGAYTNFPKAMSAGLELQGTWTPTAALWLNASYTYMKAETVEFCCAVDLTRTPTAAVNLAGVELPRSPRNKVSASGYYTWTFQPGSLSLGGSWFWIDQQNQAPFGNPVFQIAPYSLTNLSLTYRSASKHYDLVLQASNVFDQEYYTNVEAVGNNATGVTTSHTWGAPRFIQAQLRYRW